MKVVNIAPPYFRLAPQRQKPGYGHALFIKCNIENCLLKHTALFADLFHVKCHVLSVLHAELARGVFHYKAEVISVTLN